jgi:hypothetical protein
VMLLLFKEGMAAVRSQLAEMTEMDTLFINSDLLPLQTRASVVPIDFKKAGRWTNKKEYWAIIALARLLVEREIYPLLAFKEAVSARAEFAEDNLAAIEAGEKMK